MIMISKVSLEKKKTESDLFIYRKEYDHNSQLQLNRKRP